MSDKKSKNKMTKFQMRIYLFRWLKDNKIEKYRQYFDRNNVKRNKRFEFYNDEIIPLFINRLKFSLVHMAYTDIKKAVSENLIMGSFILCSCYIDYLAYYYSSNDNIGTRYKEFIKKYLGLYDPESLYKDLRCKLVHNYSEGGSYIFTHNAPINHLQLNSKYNKIYINLNNFISDLEHATEHFFNDLQNNDKMILEAVRSFKMNPLVK